MHQFNSEEAKTWFRRRGGECQRIMNPMMLHMLLLRYVGERNTHRIVARMKHRHHKFQHRDKAASRCHSIRHALSDQTGIGAEEGLAESVPDEKPDDRTPQPYERPAPNSERHPFALAHRMNRAADSIGEQNLLDPRLAILWT